MELNLEKYPNQLDDIKMTWKDIREAAKSINLYHLGDKSKTIESLELPHFNATLVNYILRENKIPGQDEIYQIYLEENSDFYNGFFDKYRYENPHVTLRARHHRSYCPILRDIELSLHLRDILSNSKTHVLYNLPLDDKGIDTLIYGTDYFKGLRSCRDTKDSIKRLGEKDKRYEKFDNVRYYINFLSVSTCDVVNKFYFYSDSNIRNILKADGLKDGDKVLFDGKILTLKYYDSWFNKWEFKEPEGNMSPVEYEICKPPIKALNYE